jgi:hypothetical protein
MRIKRTIIAPVILTLGAAGSILAGAVAPVVAAQAVTGGAVASASSPNYIYMG